MARGHCASPGAAGPIYVCMAIDTIRISMNDLRQWRQFIAVAEELHFGRAAARLHMTQPPLTMAIKQLEAQLGAVLFERTRRVVALSPAGEAALPLARSYLLPAALLEFTQLHPGHGVAIIEGTYEHLLSGLRSGESEVLIGALRNPAPASDVVQEHLFDDPLAIIARAGHPLTRARKISMAAIRGYQWIAPRAGSPLRVHFDELMSSAGVELQSPPRECNSLAAARAFLLESDRIMLRSAHQIHFEMPSGVLGALPHPAGKVVRPIGIPLRRVWRPTANQRTVLVILGRSARAAAASHGSLGLRR